MSIVDTGVENSTDRDDESSDETTSFLFSLCTTLARVFEAERAENDHLKQELAAERDARREDRHAIARDIYETHTEHDEYRSDNERDKADIRRSLHSLKDAVKPEIGMAESHKMDGEGGSQSEQTTTQRRDSPIEQVCGLPEEMARKQLTRNEQRDRYIALRIKSFASPAMREEGYRLSSQKIRHLLDEYDTSGRTLRQSNG